MTAEDKREISSLKQRGRTCVRTFRGLQQVIERFNKGPKGLEAKGLDQLTQITEEMQRLKNDWIRLINEFDRIVMKSAQKVRLGAP